MDVNFGVNPKKLGNELTKKEMNRRAKVAAENRYLQSVAEDNAAYAKAVAGGYTGPQHKIVYHDPHLQDVQLSKALKGSINVGNSNIAGLQAGFDGDNRYTAANYGDYNANYDKVYRQGPDLAKLQLGHKELNLGYTSDGDRSISYKGAQHVGPNHLLAGLNGDVSKNVNTGNVRGNVQYGWVW